MLSRTSAAHAVGVSQSDLLVKGTHAHAQLVFARREAEALLPSASPDEARAFVEQGLELRVDDAPCTVDRAQAGAVEGDGIAIEADLTCPRAPTAEASATFYFLGDLPPGHRHFARLRTDAASTQRALDGERRRLVLPILAGAAEADTPRNGVGFTGAVTLGLEHILLGWDHLLFLLALVVAERRPRALLVLVTSFTVAHSITLALATLNLVNPSPLLVEAGIAASIAYVGIENVRGRGLPRPLLTFAFGLVHGFGFAAALHGLSLDARRVLPLLGGFNVGVELGQLTVIASLFVGCQWAGRRGAFGARAVRWVSLAVALVGLCLLLARSAAFVRAAFSPAPSLNG